MGRGRSVHYNPLGEFLKPAGYLLKEQGMGIIQMKIRFFLLSFGCSNLHDDLLLLECRSHAFLLKSSD
jgi:hypothetical protein